MGLFDLFKIGQFKKENAELKQRIDSLNSDNSELRQKLTSLGADDYFAIQEKTKIKTAELEKKIQETEAEIKKKQEENQREIQDDNSTILRLREEIQKLNESLEKLNKQQKTNSKKLSRTKEIYNSMRHAIDNFFVSTPAYEDCRINKMDFDEGELISPSVILKLHAMDVKDLRKAYRENEKQINALLDQYSSRYTTKANKSIYNLMVIALRAELQNILYNLKYEKLDKSIEDVKTVSAKYLKIAGDGNQNIAGTLTKFIGELEYLFINAVKIEYNYYVKKEQARQEQLAIREQMKQEAEERKALEQEKKKIEKEESKFQTEISKVEDALSHSDSEEEISNLKKRLLELQTQLSSVVVKKEEISNLQNGKAGNVYIISNLGSFGDDVFKIGMTRRLDPQDRINELGSASVPFKFDVHSFIFSDDAVSLENKLHEILNANRLNKVNLRKEFFKINIDELEKIVTEIDPTAEFNKTMLAEEYRQSLSSDEVYTSSYTDDSLDEDDEQ